MGSRRLFLVHREDSLDWGNQFVHTLWLCTALTTLWSPTVVEQLELHGYGTKDSGYTGCRMVRKGLSLHLCLLYGLTALVTAETTNSLKDRDLPSVDNVESARCRLRCLALLKHVSTFNLLTLTIHVVWHVKKDTIWPCKIMLCNRVRTKATFEWGN